MRFFILLSFLLAGNLYLRAQPTFQKYIGGLDNDALKCVVQLSDGNLVFAGFTTLNSNQDIYLVKTDPDGNIIWQKKLSGSGIDEATSICTTHDGGFVITGSTRSFGAGDQDLLLIKMDQNGTIVWSKVFGAPYNETGYTVKKTSDNGFMVVGLSSDNAANTTSNYNGYCVKVKSDGTYEWSTTTGGISTDYFIDFLQLPDNSYIMVGATYSSSNAKHAFYIARLSSNGNFSWDKAYGGSESDFLYRIIQTQTGKIISAGSSSSYGGSRAGILMEIDVNGMINWARTYGGPGEDVIGGLTETSDNKLLVAGLVPASNGLDDLWLGKVALDGTLQWASTVGGSGAENLVGSNCLAETSGGKYILTGSTKSFGNGGQDAYFLKFDSSGYLCCDRNLLPFVATPFNPDPAITGFNVFNGTTETAAGFADIPLNLISGEVCVFDTIKANFGYITVCTGLPVLFSDSSTGTVTSWDWNFGDPTSGAGDSSALQHPSHTYLTAGTYSVTLITSGGCATDTLTMPVEVPETIDPDFTFSEQPCSHMISFLNSTSGANTYLWDFGDGSAGDSSVNPVHLYEQNGIYTVSLTANPGTDCSKTVSHELEFSLHSAADTLFIPNVFTPNGDGINDLFEAKSLHPECDEIKLMIFNRWGELIYKSDKPEWDGKRNGEIVSHGVYVVIIKGRSIDYQGTITVLQ